MENMRLMLALIVSLNTKTPLRNAQLAMTASAVSSKRPLRARTFLSAIRNISVAEALHAIEHVGGCGILQFVDNASVGEEDDAV